MVPIDESGFGLVRRDLDGEFGSFFIQVNIFIV